MSNIHGGNIFQFAHEQRIEPYEVIDFSANINPLGPSQRGLSALEAQLRYISHYPDATNDDVLNAFTWLNVLPNVYVDFSNITL